MHFMVLLYPSWERVKLRTGRHLQFARSFTAKQTVGLSLPPEKNFQGGFQTPNGQLELTFIQETLYRLRRLYLCTLCIQEYVCVFVCVYICVFVVSYTICVTVLKTHEIEREQGEYMGGQEEGKDRGNDIELYFDFNKKIE